MTSNGEAYMAHVEAEQALRHGVPRAARWAAAGGVLTGLGALLPGLWPWLAVIAGACGTLPMSQMIMGWVGTDPHLGTRSTMRIVLVIYAGIFTTFIVTLALTTAALSIAA